MNLSQRIVSAIVLIAVVVTAIVIGGPFLAVVVGVAAIIGTFEVGNILSAAGTPPIAWIAYPLALVLSIRFALTSSSTFVVSVLIVAMVVSLGASVLLRVDASRITSAVFTGLYIGLLGYFIGLENWPAGIHPTSTGIRLIALTIGAGVVSDSAAYLIGSVMGRHKIAPRISPSKSVEGSVSAVIMTVVLAAVIGPAVAPINAFTAAGLGLCVTVAGQAGDLAESALKRRAGVKDSGTLIPGHGGLLDRLDSLLLVGPVVYSYLKVLGLQ